jgi:uncharacterized protein (TIGR00266 family)
MEHEVIGTVMPHVAIRLVSGESVYTEKGGMAWMDDGIAMDTSARGGVGGALKRVFSQESIFLTSYTCTAPAASVAFTSNAPGTILPLELNDGEEVIAQKGAFLAAADSVDLAVHFQRRMRAAFFGGEGFILQKLTGPGLALFEIGGEVAEYTLADGQKMKVDPGHVALFEPSVDFSIERVKGIKNMFLGGEGLFLATLTGPGRVWLQTMPLTGLAAAINRLLPRRRN